MQPTYSNNHKIYLGDGAYVETDGYSIILTTSDGRNTTNRIVLEPEMLGTINKWMERVAAEYQETQTIKERATRDHGMETEPVAATRDHGRDSGKLENGPKKPGKENEE